MVLLYVADRRTGAGPGPDSFWPSVSIPEIYFPSLSSFWTIFRTWFCINRKLTQISRGSFQINSKLIDFDQSQLNKSSRDWVDWPWFFRLQRIFEFPELSKIILFTTKLFYLFSKQFGQFQYDLKSIILILVSTGWKLLKCLPNKKVSISRLLKKVARTRWVFLLSYL